MKQPALRSIIRRTIAGAIPLASALTAHSVAAQLVNPLGNIEDPKIFLANIIRIALGLLSVIALVMFIYGGFTFLTSGGNTERIQRAKGTLVWATIGLVVIFGSYSLLSFIVNVVVNSTK